MRDDICTIPISEVFEPKDGCPICRMRNTIESRMVEYILGAAMMEPDFRINSNARGFCKNHYKSLLQNGKALPMALVLQTHIEKQSKTIFAEKINKESKSNFLKKKCEELISLGYRTMMYIYPTKWR